MYAQAAGLGVIGISRNFLHRRFGAYCLIDTVLTNLEWPAYDRPVDWNPCVECNLCVASCPTDAIRPDGGFDFFACYNMPALLFLALHRALWGLVTGRIRLAGRRRLFLVFPRLFPTEAGSSRLHRWVFHARRALGRRR